jgi:hypothetical protein
MVSDKLGAIHYNRTVRPSHRNFVATAGQWDEWLGQYIFETIEEAQDQA